MKYKKLLILFISLLLCIGVMVITILLEDNNAPVIELKKDHYNMTCNVKLNDIYTNARVTDDEGIKDFFLEEEDFKKIVDNKKITYVAIDSSNNITKKDLYIDISKEVEDKNIELIKEATIQYKEEFKVSDYFRVVNKCGWEYDAVFDIEGLDTSKIGDHDVLVKARLGYDNLELELKMTVIDSLAPKLVLKDKEVILNEGDEFNILDYVLSVSDDKDDEKLLLENIKLSEKINTNLAGEYNIDVILTDSDNKETKVPLLITIKEEIKSEVEGE